MKEKLLTAVACPKCFAALTYNQQAQTLTCQHDQLTYKIKDGIPVLLETEALKMQATPLTEPTSQGEIS